MNENLALFARIASRAFLAWLKVLLIGGLISLVSFSIALILIGNNPGPGFAGAGHSGFGAILGLFVLLLAEPLAGLLLIASLAGLFFSMTLAGKHALQKALYLVWHYKLGDFFITRINSYLDRVFKKKETKGMAVTDATAFKKELLSTAKEDASTNKIQKKILNHILKRLRLEGINFSAGITEIRTEVVRRLKDLVGERIEPSLGLFWGLMIAQGVLIILAIIFDKS